MTSGNRGNYLWIDQACLHCSRSQMDHFDLWGFSPQVIVKHLRTSQKWRMLLINLKYGLISDKSDPVGFLLGKVKDKLCMYMLFF